jgi:hypothetical protein
VTKFKNYKNKTELKEKLKENTREKEKDKPIN